MSMNFNRLSTDDTMIAEAKRDNRSAKLHFSVQDMFRLPYANQSFNVVIVSNALHIVPQPEKALQEIKRVLKDDGVLIAPTFTHAGNSFSGMVKAFFMKLAGFPPVSYTHLDVYKRQALRNAAAAVPDQRCRCGPDAAGGARAGKSIYPRCGAVSYTHLDVYKRQTLDAANSSAIFKERNTIGTTTYSKVLSGCKTT